MDRNSNNLSFNSKFISFFWFFIVLIIPFLFSVELVDEDNLPKLFFITLSMVILSARLLIRPSKYTIQKNELLIVGAITIYFVYSFTKAEIFSSR